jgi:epoxyqueuosine reductase QueG
MDTAANDPRFPEALIRGYLADPANNRIEPGSAERAWDAPLVGFARGDDPIFASYKTHVDPQHWTPLEAFRLAHPGTDATAGALAVLAWILPQTAQVRQDHRKEKELPSRRWALTRKFGEEINAALRAHVVERLQRAGVEACAPVRLKEWTRVEGGPFVFASTWSERHAAHAAGLGTFGLCDGLITPLGKSIRVGTVVARAPWPASPRPYKGHRDWCLFFATGKCGACIKRCPAGALSPAGHDKRKCKAYIRGVTSPYVEAKLLGVPVNACGLCQTGVPCERGIPAALQKRAKA